VHSQPSLPIGQLSLMHRLRFGLHKNGSLHLSPDVHWHPSLPT
jgi:hypothetical protein